MEYFWVCASCSFFIKMFKNQQGNAYSSVKILNEKKSGFRRAQWSCLSKLEIILQENISKGLSSDGGRGGGWGLNLK